MNYDPNSNPYSPSGYSIEPVALAKVPLRGYAKVACIFFIILGALGLLQLMAAIAQLAVASLMPQEGGLDPNSLFPGAMAVGIVFIVLNGAVSIAELLGGILGLKQKLRGANLIRFTSAFMVFLKLVETAYGVVVGFMMIEPMKQQLNDQMQNQPEQPGVDIGAFIEIGIYVGISFAVVMGLAMLAFYLFTFLFFSKQTTLAQFS